MTNPFLTSPELLLQTIELLMFLFSALIVRYMTRRFIVDYSPEISKIYQHQTVMDQEEVSMEIWDTAGHFQVSC